MNFLSNSLLTHVRVDCRKLHNDELNDLYKKKVNQSHYRPELPRGFQEVKILRLHDNGPGWW